MSWKWEAAANARHEVAGPPARVPSTNVAPCYCCCVCLPVGVLCCAVLVSDRCGNAPDPPHAAQSTARKPQEHHSRSHPRCQQLSPPGCETAADQFGQEAQSAKMQLLMQLYVSLLYTLAMPAHQQWSWHNKVDHTVHAD